MTRYLLYIFFIAAAGVLIKASFTSAGITSGASILSDSIVSVTDSVKIIEIAEGKKLYKDRCGKCHTLYKPKDYKLKTWKENLVEMRVKADLNKNEYNLILQYLAENCKK
jgi:cytochrome c2